MSLLPKSIHRRRRYPTKFNSGRDIPLESANFQTRRTRKRNFTGGSFWARGYFVSTVGLDEEVAREYIRDQEKEGQRLEQLNLVWSAKKAQ